MKTKYSQIVKLKKFAVDNVENQLQLTQKNIIFLNEKLKEQYDELHSVHMPKSGMVNDFQKVAMVKEMIKEQIEDTKKQIDRFLIIKERQMEELKVANIEYEKMKHLDEVEQEIILKNLAKLEAKQLDEIGLMLFTGRKFI